jgi:hypothetical protein
VLVGPNRAVLTRLPGLLCPRLLSKLLQRRDFPLCHEQTRARQQNAYAGCKYASTARDDAVGTSGWTVASAQASGRMFWRMRKKFFGSYLFAAAADGWAHTRRQRGRPPRQLSCPRALDRVSSVIDLDGHIDLCNNDVAGSPLIRARPTQPRGTSIFRSHVPTASLSKSAGE